MNLLSTAPSSRSGLLQVASDDWLAPEQLPTYGACALVKAKLAFYWVGLTNNKKHKYSYLEFHGEMGITTNNCIGCSAAVSESGAKIEALEDSTRHGLVRQCVRNLHDIDAFLVKFFHLLTVAGTPIDMFVGDYMAKRDSYVCKLEDDLAGKNNLQIDELRAVANFVTFAACEITTMGEFIKLSVDANDQMLTRILLLVFNFLTFIGQYVYNTRLKKLLGEMGVGQISSS
mmetsp:Transcript_29303/g.80202  ORF Transcript_29303/g.80202 Transcript_29303/m.80202 type:complete len:230 (+) Transcript_29303:91-780(+)